MTQTLQTLLETFDINDTVTKLSLKDKKKYNNKKQATSAKMLRDERIWNATHYFFRQMLCVLYGFTPLEIPIDFNLHAQQMST